MARSRYEPNDETASPAGWAGRRERESPRGLQFASTPVALRTRWDAGDLPDPDACPRAGAPTVEASLRPRPVTLDLGGVEASTWGYSDAGSTLVRGTAGDLFRVTVDNELSASTSVHWHGIRLHHAADGVPGVSQEPIEPGQRFVYEFVAPDPGTYFSIPTPASSWTAHCTRR